MSAVAESDADLVQDPGEVQGRGRDEVRDPDAVPDQDPGAARGPVRDAARGPVRDVARGPVQDVARGPVQDVARGPVRDAVPERDEALVRALGAELVPDAEPVPDEAQARDAELGPDEAQALDAEPVTDEAPAMDAEPEMDVVPEPGVAAAVQDGTAAATGVAPAEPDGTGAEMAAERERDGIRRLRHHRDRRSLRSRPHRRRTGPGSGWQPRYGWHRPVGGSRSREHLPLLRSPAAQAS